MGVDLTILSKGKGGITIKFNSADPRFLATGISLGIQRSPDALVEKARAAMAQGYRKVKIKIAPGQDVAYIAAAREALKAKKLSASELTEAYLDAIISRVRELLGADYRNVQDFGLDTQLAAIRATLDKIVHMHRALRTDYQQKFEEEEGEPLLALRGPTESPCLRGVGVWL